MSMWTIGAGALGAGLLRAGYSKFGAWKAYRNSLPDEQRAMIFWNDRNYELLEDWINYTIWGLTGVAAIVAVLFLLALNGVFD